MSSGFFGPEGFGSSPFDDFLARISGGGGGPPRPGPTRRHHPADEPAARDLLSIAAAQAAERGGVDLDTNHLLWSAARLEPTRQLLARAGADPG